MLLWTCSSGPIECGFDNSASNFQLNFQVPLLNTWKIFEKTFATENFSLNFCSVRLSCGFDTQGWLFVSEKKVTQRFKEATNRKVYFYHLFLKVLLWTREMRLRQPCVKIFGEKSDLPVQIPKFFMQKLLFQERF